MGVGSGRGHHHPKPYKPTYKAVPKQDHPSIFPQINFG
jgi:hypothetical protein